jgi:hypothetical protein
MKKRSLPEDRERLGRGLVWLSLAGPDRGVNLVVALLC